MHLLTGAHPGAHPPISGCGHAKIAALKNRFRGFPLPPVSLDGELLALLSDAGIALGRLDGIVKVIPDPDFFVGIYVRREAVVSSQIEGTQSTLEDLLEVELKPAARDRYADVGDIVNYIAAINHGLTRIDELPLSLRLIREIHAELVRDGWAHARRPSRE